MGNFYAAKEGLFEDLLLKFISFTCDAAFGNLKFRTKKGYIDRITKEVVAK